MRKKNPILFSKSSISSESYIVTVSIWLPTVKVGISLNFGKPSHFPLYLHEEAKYK